MPEETPEYQAGAALGVAVVNIFKALAALDGVTFHEAVESWMSSYVAARIMDATGEDDATG